MCVCRPQPVQQGVGVSAAELVGETMWCCGKREVVRPNEERWDNECRKGSDEVLMVTTSISTFLSFEAPLSRNKQ